ncbi:response regulator transcription factor [Aestuariibacter sp. A3R04]|uniref:response regulator n=1 Tax=Aestuariibacter sp. A3R04 TaxID=2841571 RepID=UPI001C08FFD0|nr:response regulator transcription factor [Aestuariibacter sp. A3R04]MBU3022541.1 response regulator transcription factor [Aestuariibacter sp. A3R04]
MQANVLIADDHPLFRAAMRQALTDIVGENIAEAASFPEARKALRIDEAIELVFLDIHMPGNDGLTGLSEIRTSFPNVLVVIVSAEDSPVLIRKAIDLGASGYIPKSTPLPVIADAVTQVLDGEQWLPDGLDGTLSQYRDSSEAEFAERLAQLTPHQFTVLKMMSDGLLNKQIAYELSISESTVKQHVSAVLRKLNVINRTKAGVLFRQLTGAD